MPAEQAAGEVGAGVADPGTEKDERVREHPVREEPRAVDEAHEHGRVQEAEDRRRDLSRVEPRKRVFSVCTMSNGVEGILSLNLVRTITVMCL